MTVSTTSSALGWPAAICLSSECNQSGAGEQPASPQTASAIAMVSFSGEGPEENHVMSQLFPFGAFGVDRDEEELRRDE